MIPCICDAAGTCIGCLVKKKIYEDFGGGAVEYLSELHDRKYRSIEDDPVEFLESMKILELFPGDALVLTTSVPIPEVGMKHITEVIQKTLDVQVPVIILDAGMDLGVIRKKEVLEMDKIIRKADES